MVRRLTTSALRKGSFRTALHIWASCSDWRADPDTKDTMSICNIFCCRAFWCWRTESAWLETEVSSPSSSAIQLRYAGFGDTRWNFGEEYVSLPSSKVNLDIVEYIVKSLRRSIGCSHVVEAKRKVQPQPQPTLVVVTYDSHATCHISLFPQSRRIWVNSQLPCQNIVPPCTRSR